MSDVITAKKIKKKFSRLTIFFAITSFLLAAILVTASLFFLRYKKNFATDVIAMQTQSENLSKLQSEIDASIPIEELKANAQLYNISPEFLQRFFDDMVVYRGVNGITYAPIDKDIPANNLDFSNIVKVDGEKQYQEDGVTKSIKGIDVSKYQGEIDWEKVKGDGVEFAMLRVGIRGYSTGKIEIDPQFEKNVKGATKAGVKVGAYFYSHAITMQEAQEEAQIVINALKGYNITYPVAYDTEEVFEEDVRSNDIPVKELTDIAIAFCEQIKSAGYTPMIYSNIKWYMEHLDLTRLTQYDKWFAQYYDAPFFPYSLQMWQYTGKGKVEGIDSEVDMNICFKDYSIEE